MCSEIRVEVIYPDYPRNIIDPQSSGLGSGEAEDAYTGDCFKLDLKQPYHGNNYSVTFKRTTLLDMFHSVVAKMKQAKLSNDAIDFTYYYSIRKDNQIIMVVGMNSKALHMVSDKE